MWHVGIKSTLTRDDYDWTEDVWAVDEVTETHPLIHFNVETSPILCRNEETAERVAAALNLEKS